MDGASAGGVSGLVFSILFSLVVIGAIVFLCWAHKAKVSQFRVKDEILILPFYSTNREFYTVQGWSKKVVLGCVIQRHGLL